MMDEARTTWPRRFPAYLFGGLVLALACGGLMVRAWVQFAPSLQRFYLPTYATQALLGSLPKFGTKATVKPYPMVFIGRQPATEALLAENPLPLSMKLISFEPRIFQAWLRVRIYGGKALGRLMLWPLIGTGFCVLLFGGFGALLDRSRNREAEATSIALGLWPDEPNQQPFFKKHPRAIFAYLISRFSAWNNPSDPATCETLGRWLSNPRTEVTPRLVGTRHAVSTDANAKDQSAGLWATLGEVATPLLMMPTTAENRPHWTVREWGKQRRGWIFITSTPNTLDALRPLQSLWLDMLILKLQSPEQHEGQKRVWTMLDEVRLLNRLPQLEMALTGQRKADCPIVIGFQGMSQLIKIYGQQDAETIVSQPFTKVLLRTSDERAAQHLSKTIGNVELERVNESMPAHWFGGSHSRHSFSSQRVVSPLVMPSEIQSFDNLNGYFVQPGKAVKITVARQPKVARAEALIERMISPAKIPAIESETNRDPETTPEAVQTLSISAVL